MAKILSVTPYRYTPPENGGHHGVILVDKLLNIHNAVLSLSTDDNLNADDQLTVETAYILTSSVRRYLPFSLTSVIDRKIKEFQATHLFIHHHYLFPSAFRAAKKNNIPLYIRSHNIETDRFRSLGKAWWPLMEIFEKWSYKHADRVFFVTEEDKNKAINSYRLAESRAAVMPFGINCDKRPEPLPGLKKKVAGELGLDEHVPWIFFMGKLDYPPNAQAVQDIVHHIYPVLKDKKLRFQLLIFGKNLDQGVGQHIQSLNAQNGDIYYLGFVPVIEELLASCDLMLNPVNTGGGVKTKVVESIAWNNTVISSETGAGGMEKDKCGPQLILVKDEDWPAYADEVCARLQSDKKFMTPEMFYDYYSLDRIADRMQKYF